MIHFIKKYGIKLGAYGVLALSNVGNIGATSVVPMDSFVNTIRVLDQPILDKIKKQHKFSIKYFHWPDTIPLSSYVLPDDVFACGGLTPSGNEQRRQVIDQAIQNYKAKNPEKYDAYMNQRQDYINSRNNGCDFNITHLKPYGANALSQTVLDSLNSIFSAQPYGHYANSFEVSSVVVDNIEDMFPNAFNPSTNELHYFDAIEDMIDYFFDNNLQSTHLVKVTLPPNVNFTGITQNGMPVNPPGVASTGSPALPLLEPDIEGRFGDAFYRHAAGGPVWQVVAHETGHNVQGGHTNEIPGGNSGPCIMNSSILGTSFSPFMRGRIGTAFSNVGPSGLGYTTHECATDTPLPIIKISFDARYDDNTTSVQLDWTVASQVNTDRMVIEHSVDGRLWSEIPSCDIKGAGTVSAEMSYSCVHTSPVSGVINYYRIVDYDYDGRKNVGPMQSITLPVGKEMSYNGSNPVQVGQPLLISGTTSAHSVEILSLNGSIVRSYATVSSDIKAPDQAGMFIIRLVDANGSAMSYKLVVTE